MELYYQLMGDLIELGGGGQVDIELLKEIIWLVIIKCQLLPDSCFALT